MEYEKQINRLVLGYLKNECKSAYKIFLKTHFQNHHKHIATRVAGQTLEDILRIYSKLQDIVQGRLEDTDYYKENGADFSSPIYLPEQLLYLLDKGRPYTPVSSSCNRSPAASSIAETYHGNNDVIDHTSDVETTPEHSLPGNTHNDYNNHLKTPFRRKSPVFRTPYLEKLPTSEHENISSVMTMKLLEKTEFHEKLAQNITTALNTPELSSSFRKGESEADKKGLGVELEDTIKHALNRTEADPMFQDLLQDFYDPIENAIEKAIACETATTSSSSTTTTTSGTPSHSFSNVEDQNRGAISSMLALSNANMHYKSATSDAGSSSDYGRNGNNSEPKAVSTERLGNCNIGTSDHGDGHVQQNFPKHAENQQIIYPTTGMYSVPSTTSMIQTTSQQQQFYIVNQPLVIPQPLSIFQPVPVAANNSKLSKKSLPKPNVPLTEQDIMSMPTLILNDRNEITYADPASLIATTPYKLNEVHNIKEYLNAFGATDQSHVIKQTTQKPQSLIKPTPTIKVEVFQRNSPLRTVGDVEVISSGSSSNATKELPNLNDTDVCKEVPTNSNKEVAKSTSQDSRGSHVNEKEPESIISLCTPSPVVTTARKPTPKSSGSHVRNLTFPSPIRKSNEKPDANRNSPTIVNKQQATKDLFNNKSEGEAEKTVKNNSSPKRKGRSREKRESKSPKKTTSPSKPARTESPKRVTKPLKKNPSKDNDKNANKDDNNKQIKTPKSWDAALRKNLTAVNVENQSTPKRTTSRRRSKRPTESDITEADGKKLEEALKTPAKSEKSKRKTPTTKKNVKPCKPAASEKLPRVEEVTNAETKKILSPSKLCNTASKRNMEVDGITPSNTKAGSNQPLLNARKNINSLLETPLKDDGTPSMTEKTSDPTNTTPFTPMLKANLKDFTVGDTFSIDTPDFPVTPGLSLMEHSSAAYCILNDTETNKVTEAIVLSEERKSSVRKTDDEDFEMSPKVYGCKVILDDFNKNRTGKKNLELLDNKGVSWDGSSDREDKSDDSGSSSEEETNSTVIQKSDALSTAASRNLRSAGKSMATLKSRLLEKTRDRDESFDTSSLEHGNRTLNSDADEEDEATQVNDNDSPPKLKSTGTDKESETVSDKKHKSRLGKNYVEMKTKEHNPKESRNTRDKVINEEDNNKRSSKGRETSKVEAAKEDTPKVPPRNAESTLTSVTVDVIKQAVSSVPENCCSRITSAYSLKAEIDEKRRRVIELEKASHAPKTPSRRKAQSDEISPRNKRKRAAPRKSPAVNCREEQNEGTLRDFEKVDSQDEFFKRSGTNLHRTNKQQMAENASETSFEEPTSKEGGNKEDTSLKAERDGSLEKKVNELSTRPKEIDEDKEATGEINKNEDATVNDNADASWDSYVIELQPEAKVVVYDEQHTCKKSFKDYDFSLVKKQLHVMIPLADGSSQPVLIQATPYKLLFEIEPSANSNSSSNSNCIRRGTPDCSSDSENVGPKVVDHEELKGAKKRKHRSDSCNSDSSSKKMKTSLPRNCLNENNIAKLLTKLHGPSDKT